MWPACSGGVLNGSVGQTVLGNGSKGRARGRSAAGTVQEQHQPCDGELAEPWLTQRGTRPFPGRRSKRGAVTQRGLAGAPSASRTAGRSETSHKDKGKPINYTWSNSVWEQL